MQRSSTSSRPARLWVVLGRVRDVRVRRRLAALAQAQRAVQAAQAACDEQVRQAELHAARLVELLAWRAHGPHGPAIRRHALDRHRRQDESLTQATEAARAAFATAVSDLSRIGAALRREMTARDDARARERAAKAKARMED
jgi:hypothetical protein